MCLCQLTVVIISIWKPNSIHQIICNLVCNLNKGVLMLHLLPGINRIHLSLIILSGCCFFFFLNSHSVSVHLLLCALDALLKSSSVWYSVLRQDYRTHVKPNCVSLASGDELHRWVSTHRHKRWREILLADGGTARQNFTRWVFLCIHLLPLWALCYEARSI